MATTPELHEPQIAAARQQAWHQTGEALLTLEAARTWLNGYGLVLFGPRGGSLGAPAPSLVEATLGTAKASATLAETGTARTLTARLVGEGSAVPLNLFGGPGDLPDFLVSAQAFPFVFTLRGDKGWKRPPETSGSVKVTPLGLRVYELLSERGAQTIAAIVSEVGREVTESAIARALSELWQLLRVIPVLQQGQGDTVWELTTARFLKGIKAGANAGQPTALSALASLYLTQALVATEEEIAGFLSPLTARSRVRDVLHGLIAGRQLAEGVVNGKTVLYMPDALPDFAQFAEPEAKAEEGAAAGAGAGEETAAASPEGEPRERIRRFGQDKGRPQDRNLRGKPVGRAGAKRASFRPEGTRPRAEGDTRPPREGRSEGGARPGGRSFGSDRERPARREAAGEGFKKRRPASDRPSFAKPWDEERKNRPPRDRAAGEGGAERRPRAPRGDRPEGDARPPRPFSDRREGRPPRRDEDRPFRRREGSAEGGEERRRPAPRGDRPPRPFRPKAEEGDRPQRPFRPRAEGGDRPFRPRPEGGTRPFRPRPRTEGEDRPFRARPEGGDRPFRPRSRGEDGDRPFRARPRSEGDGERPFGRREGGAGERRGSGRPSGGSYGGARRAPAGGTGRPSGDRGARPGGRPGFRPAGKKAPGKFAGKPRTERPARRPRPEDEA